MNYADYYGYVRRDDRGLSLSTNMFTLMDINNALDKPKINIQIKDYIKKVIFNDQATIILWNDGAKTVVKCGDLDYYDPEKGMAMCIAKYVLGNKGNYYNVFKKWLPEEVDLPVIEVKGYANNKEYVKFETEKTCSYLDGQANNE